MSVTEMVPVIGVNFASLNEKKKKKSKTNMESGYVSVWLHIVSTRVVELG